MYVKHKMDWTSNTPTYQILWSCVFLEQSVTYLTKTIPRPYEPEKPLEFS
jgi:hypothetical protein